MYPIMPFIVGSPRSGTTLLRFALAAHSALAIPPETGFVGYIAADAALAQIGPDELLHLITTFPPAGPAWSDFGVPEESLRRAFAALENFSVADGLRCFYRLYAARHGKPRFGDKTPIQGRVIADIGRLLPEAAFIHIIRDGRDASLSLRDMWFAPSRDITALAAYWRDNVSQCREQGRTVERYMEVRYEDLLRDMAGQLRQICAFIDLPFEPAMLRYHEIAPRLLAEHRERRAPDGAIIVSHQRRLAQQSRVATPPEPSRIGGWRSGLTVEEKRAFQEAAGALLDELGYRTC